MRALVPLAAAAVSLGAAELEVQYIAHAAFLLTSPERVRVAIDPYNSHVWLRYTFPENLSAEAVLVSHPHFDHDAHYGIRGFPAVFRQPGRYAVGDVKIEGVRGKHADPYGTEFGQLNTVWVVEAAGVRVAHLGDNGPLTAAMVSRMGRVDVLLAPVDDTEHILKFAELEAIISVLRPRVIVPMHYRLSGELGPEDLGGLEKWLRSKAQVQPMGQRVRFSPQTLPPEPTVFWMKHSDQVRPWSPEFREAIGIVRQFNRLRQETREKPTQEQLAEMAPRLARVTVLEPGFIAGWHARAVFERFDGRMDEAIRLLQTGLTASYPDDTERTTLARALLAELLTERGRKAEARVQWLELLRSSHRADLLEKAKTGTTDEPR